MSGVLRGAAKSAFKKHNLQIIAKRSFTSPSSSSSGGVKDVPGLSKKIVDVPSNEVGPGASKKSTYKNPEYYCYHNASYFEAEVEMMKYRLPQPSNKTTASK